MNAPLFVVSLGLALCPVLPAFARSSANYSIPADAQDSGGLRSTSANYTIDNGVGAIGGLNASPNNTGKNGFIGQLYDVTALVVGASPATVSETASRQLSTTQSLDDATFIAVNASSVGWSVLSGPIVSISSGGLATAGNVFRDTLASVQASFQGKNGSLNLTVVNVGTDDFGSYAGDGIDDSWQVQYFGQPPNPLAGPNADADGTGQNNLFKFIAGLNPLDGSRFNLSILPVNGQPSQKQVVFNPTVAGRTYIPQFADSLTIQNWQALTGTTQSDDGATRTVTDPNASLGQKFYRVQISKP